MKLSKEEIRSRLAGEGPERRVATLRSVEVRDAEGDDRAFTFEGHAAVFDKLSVPLGGFREKIDRGAFRKVLRDKPDVRFLYNHDENFVLARTTNDTLRLREDGHGLLAEADVAPVSYADDLRVLLDRGDVTQMSFAFRVGDDSWEEDEEGRTIRTIHEFSDLVDVSAVTYPAYPDTDATARSLSVMGLDVADEEGEPDRDILEELAARIHAGEYEASPTERAEVESLLARLNTVAPWEVERVIRAIAEEPELAQAALPDKRVTVEIGDATGPVEAIGLRAARERRLRVRERALRGGLRP